MARAVIVGGGGTGDAAAFALRKRGFDGEVVVISADDDRPYDRPYLSKEFLRGEIDGPKVFLHDEAEYAKERIELRLDQRVTGGSLRERKVNLAGGARLGSTSWSWASVARHGACQRFRRRKTCSRCGHCETAAPCAKRWAVRRG